MFCCNCGKEIPDEGVFCPECGVKQEPQQVVEDPAYGEVPVYEEMPVYEETPVYEEVSAYEEPAYQAPEYALQCDENCKLCESCGAAIPLDSRFCPECRARQSSVAAMNVAGRAIDPYQLSRVKAALQKLITPKMKAAFQKHKKQLAMIAGVAAVACLVLAVVFSLIKPRVNLNDYITIYAEGFDGYGYAQVEFDRARFYRDFGKELAQAVYAENGEQDKNSSWNNSETNSGMYAKACDTFLAECVDAQLLNQEMLSEGDEITLQWTCKDATALNKYGCKLLYKDITYVAKSLQEARVFDPFEGLEVVFEGIAPYGRAYLEGESVAPAAENMYFKLDTSGDLSNGDTVTITIDSYQDNLVQFCIEEYGMVPASLTKEVTVTGLSSYVTQNAQLSAEALAILQQQAEDTYSARMAQNKQQGESLEAFEYLGNYLMINKDQEMFGGYHNRLYLVYKVQMKNQYTNGESNFAKTTDLYWFINFNDVMVDDAGEVSVDMSRYDLPHQTVQIDSGVSNGRYNTQVWKYSGYQTLEGMYTDVVAVNVETYTCDSTISTG